MNEGFREIMTCFMDILIALRDDHEAVGNSHLAIERDFKVNVYVRVDTNL